MTAVAPAAGIARTARMLLFAALALLLACPCPAQQTAARVRCSPVFYWGVDIGTATLSGFLQGRSKRVPVTRALAGGVAGGSLIYAGQRLVGTGKPGLRFVGLQTVAVGASVARNLGTGRGPLEQLTFPVFPLYVQRDATAQPEWSARLSVVALAGLIRTAHEFRVWPDWRESLLAGVPVFAVPAAQLDECPGHARLGDCASGTLGHHVLGAIAYASRPQQTTARDILAHELGHVAQDMRDVVLHAVPASDAALRTEPAGRWLSRFLVLDVVLPLNLASRAAGPPQSDPACRDLPSFYECETEAMKPALP